MDAPLTTGLVRILTRKMKVSAPWERNGWSSDRRRPAIVRVDLFLSAFAALTLPYLDVGEPELLYTGSGGEPGRFVFSRTKLLLGLTL